MMMTVYTIQHTESQHHVNGMVGSWTDWPLTEKGLAQANRIGEHLCEELAGEPVVLYTSDLQRAQQTAEQIGAQLGCPLISRPELRERNLGRCCGKSVAWLRENLECPERTVDDRLFSDGESRRDMWNRLAPFVQTLLSGNAPRVLIVSHGDLLSAFFAMFLGLPVEALDHSELSGRAGGVSRLEIADDGKRRIRYLNDSFYIR